MTDKQFWMKADQISESKKTVEEKADLLARLLKTAYDENLKMVILLLDDRHFFMNLDDDHPNTIGNRCLFCYTSKQKAESDIRAMAYGIDWGYVYTQEVLNNLFNKAIIGHLGFNCFREDWVVIVSKETLMKYISGPYPLPEGFVDAPASGYPVIPEQYRK